MKKYTKHKFLFFIVLLFVIALLGASGYLIYNLLLLKNIEDVLRIVAMIASGVISLLFLCLSLRFLRKYKKVKLIFCLILMLVFAGAEAFVGYNIAKVYGSIQKVTKTSNYITYSSSLVTLKENKASSLDDVKKETLGILEDETSYEGFIIPNEIIDKKDLNNKTESFDSFIAMIDALKDGKIKYIFLPTNYSIMYGSIDGYEDLADTTKVLYTQTKKVKKKSDEKSKKSTKPITEPFTLLLMGVDSETEGIANSSFNGDSLMVITFNPDTLSTTILSIPRDSYVPISCFANKKKNKITHAAWQGESCMQRTIENFLDIDIDYYVKINFRGVVQLVDAVGGVEIDVPYNFCEQNSRRQWGGNTVFVEAGKQVLNGEKALAYSRNRHPNPGFCSAKWTNYNADDFTRGLHQQEVIMALLNKVKTINSLDTIHEVLDTISNNMNTNMSTEQILSLYNVFKDISSKASKKSDMATLLGIQRLYLNGYSQRIYDYGGINLSLYNYVLYDDSIKAVSDAMKENLGLKKAKTVKTFKFNINEPYKEVVIGKDKTSKSSLTLLPNFTGQSLSYVNSYCGSHGIKVTVEGNGTGNVISQSVPAGANVEDVSSITIKLAGETKKKEEPKEEEPIDDNPTDQGGESGGTTPSDQGGEGGGTTPSDQGGEGESSSGGTNP